MKIPRIAIEALRIKCIRDDKKRNKAFHLDPKYRLKEDVHYLDDNHPLHTFDVIYAPIDVKRKRCCIVDIHGGGYIFGFKKSNHRFLKVFADAGYDCISVEYIPNNGKRSAQDLIEDCLNALRYITTHLEELQLDVDCFVITGDSAGGHLALTISQMICDPKYYAKITEKPLNINLIATLVNCTVCNYISLGKAVLTKRADKRLIGLDSDDEIKRTLLDPYTHLSSLTVPLFASTCKHDFIRGESLLLKKAMEDKDNIFRFIDLDTDQDKVGHVHNIVYPDLEESKYINNQMIKFIDEVIDNQAK